MARGTHYSKALQDRYVRRFDDAQRAFFVNASEFAREMGIDPYTFAKWVRARGVEIIHQNDHPGAKGPRRQYWRHGGITTTPRRRALTVR